MVSICMKYQVLFSGKKNKNINNLSSAAESAHRMLSVKIAPYTKRLRINPFMASIKGTFANSVDSDQTPQNAASAQGLPCLLLISVKTN